MIQERTRHPRPLIIIIFPKLVSLIFVTSVTIDKRVNGIGNAPSNMIATINLGVLHLIAFQLCCNRFLMSVLLFF